MNTIYKVQWLQLTQSGFDCSQLGLVLEYPDDSFVFRPLEATEEDAPKDMKD